MIQLSQSRTYGMNDGLNKNKIRFMILPTRFCPAEYISDYNKAYICWKEVWSKTFTEEMNLTETLYSDNFTRQTHIAVIFYGDEVASLTTLNDLDLLAQTTWDDSYFKVWPEFTKFKLKKKAKRALACTNVTLAKKFRRGALGLSWKDFMISMLVKYLKHSSYDAMISVLRLEKGMDRCAYRTGASPLVRDIPYSIEGRRVDIAFWDKKINEKNLDQKIQNLVNFIWNQATLIISPKDPQFVKGERNAA